MTDQALPEKSCGPQLIDDEQPSRSWGLEKLSQFALEQHRRITDGEKEIAPAYWLLGQALNLARKEFGRGHWAKYLAELGIHKTRASKARAIFRNFQSLQEVVGHSVEEAYDQRVRISGRSTRTAKRKLKGKGTSLQAFLGNVPKETKTLIEEATSVRPTEARRLIAAVDAAIQNLQRLRNLLESKADSEDEVSLSRTPN